MNEFIEQFLIEARALVEQATDDLLTLEQRPSDKERLDSAFRAFHTLKGSAGIVDFAAMGRALHAAEDVLAEVRAAASPVTQDLVSDCLSCLDEVTRWLEATQSSGELPTDEDAAADSIVARFARSAAPPKTDDEAGLTKSDAWLREVLHKHPQHLSQAKAAIRYVPDSQCFFRGEDPLAVIAALPGLLTLEISPVDTWPSLEAFDPFACQLVLTALTSVPIADVRSALAAVRDQVEVLSLGGGTAALSPSARELIGAQIALLAEGSGDGFVGRLSAAGRVAANVLRHAGLVGEAIQLGQLLVACQNAADAGAMLAALSNILTGSLAVGRQETKLAAAAQEATATALRVDVARIDALVRLTSELTVVKNAIGHTANVVQEGRDLKLHAAKLKEQHALLDRLIGELQRSVLNVRVLPLRHVFQRFPRLVRDMGISLGKPVRLMTEGEDTDADKAIVESLFEPLLHVLRNAIDHGIEGQQERSAQAKPATAIIRLRGMRQGDNLAVEVSDDGRGVDVTRVRQVAGERGLASAETLAAMSEDEIVNLIFAPGFSTAKEVTGLSGRGVGMDAARETIERMGGRVGVQSRPGQGTTVRFTLPFSILISRVMTVEVGAQIFGVPLECAAETIRIPRDRISRVGAAPAFVLRNRTLPLCNLADMLGVARTGQHSADATIVVIQLAGQPTGLEVDRVGERMDVMLKPMEGLLSGTMGVAGTTLLGDGRVLIVLDLQQLLQ